MLTPNSKIVGLSVPFNIIVYTVYFIKLYNEEFQQYTQNKINNSKVLTESVHIPKCFGGGHYHHQGIQNVS
jgi:predicted metallopeptidase